MRVQLAAITGAPVVVDADHDLILIDPDLPEDHALLLICALTDARCDVASGWLSAAYAQDPRRVPEPRQAPDPGRADPLGHHDTRELVYLPLPPSPAAATPQPRRGTFLSFVTTPLLGLGAAAVVFASGAAPEPTLPTPHTGLPPAAEGIAGDGSRDTVPVSDSGRVTRPRARRSTTAPTPTSTPARAPAEPSGPPPPAEPSTSAPAPAPSTPAITPTVSVPAPSPPVPACDVTPLPAGCPDPALAGDGATDPAPEPSPGVPAP